MKKRKEVITATGLDKYASISLGVGWKKSRFPHTKNKLVALFSQLAITHSPFERGMCMARDEWQLGEGGGLPSSP